MLTVFVYKWYCKLQNWTYQAGLNSAVEYFCPPWTSRIGSDLPVNNKVDAKTRTHFRDWLRQELKRLDFYQRRGDHYLIREFAKYCVEQGAPIDEASLGRYLRDDDPVLPTPERCRSLARVLEHSPVQVFIEAGYFVGNDLFRPLPTKVTASVIDEQIRIRQEALQQLGKVRDDSPLAILPVQIEGSIKNMHAEREKVASGIATETTATTRRGKASAKQQEGRPVEAR